ncbi:MAG: hypothetical protein CL916_06935 [Deltaproteobacteria bacterium]|nr:hypothetical protein [Deltaproteobacteria bacterium]
MIVSMLIACAGVDKNIQEADTPEAMNSYAASNPLGSGNEADNSEPAREMDIKDINDLAAGSDEMDRMDSAGGMDSAGDMDSAGGIDSVEDTDVMDTMDSEDGMNETEPVEMEMPDETEESDSDDESNSPSSTAAYESFLSERIGFGAAATGGQSGHICRVTSLNDTGPGTLRECAENSQNPTWIRFEIDGDITLSSPINLRSNTTIDGRNHYIRLYGEGLILSNVSNIIITNIIFKEGTGGDTNDALKIIDSTHTVWVHHVSFSNYGDGLVDITLQATNITVSWCKFSNHRKVMLISASPETTEDAVIQVTIHHNWFKKTNSRHPRLRFGKVHAFNNYFDAWGHYGMGCSQLGQCYSEANVFEADDDTDAIIKRVGEDTNNGKVKSVNDLLLNGADIQENGTVFTPSDFYTYNAERASQNLAEQITEQAGWQP